MDDNFLSFLGLTIRTLSSSSQGPIKRLNGHIWPPGYSLPTSDLCAPSVSLIFGMSPCSVGSRGVLSDVRVVNDPHVQRRSDGDGSLVHLGSRCVCQSHGGCGCNSKQNHKSVLRITSGKYNAVGSRGLKNAHVRSSTLKDPMWKI